MSRSSPRFSPPEVETTAALEGSAMLEMRKDIFADERDDNLKEVGRATQRQDVLGHVTGTSAFYDDHRFANLLHLKVLRSPHAHARIRAIDDRAAASAPGVKRVIRAADVPVNLNTLLSLIQFGKDDEPSLATDVVRYKGEPILAVVATSERAARQAIDRVRITYDPLPAVFDVEEALKPGAVSVNPAYPKNTFEYYGKYDHQKLRFGDAEAALARADMVLEGCYQMSPIEHAPTETNGSIAAPDTNDRFVVYTSTQALFFSLDTAAKINAMPSNQLHFIGGTVGGGFGGKVDTLTEPLAILGARLTGAPVRYRLSRHEEMQFGSPRGAERIYIKDGVMRDGRIIARKITAYFDSGAYTRLSSYAVVKCVAHIPGPYTIPNVHADVYCVFTNRTPATAMRGFGVTALDFALECQMDKNAFAIGIDPLEFRLLNAYRDGDMKAHRREAKNCALIECAQVAAEKANWPLREDFRRMSSRTGRVVAPSDAVTPVGVRPRAEPPSPQRVPYDRASAELRPPSRAPTPPAAPPSAPQPAGSTHGARRFSSVFGTRRR
jgi:CO/xanthine dehydrogenase Mo-binding subunit